MKKGRTVIRIAAVIVIAVLCLLALDLFLYPCTFTRLDVHAITTQTFDDVFVGTSHGKMNIDPESMQEVNGRTGHNLCVGGEYPADIYYMTKLMIETGHKPQRLVFEADPGYLVREKEEGNNYLLFYHEFPMTIAKAAYFADTLTKCDFRTWLFPWYEYSLKVTLPRAGKTAATRLSGDYRSDEMKSATQAYHDSGFIERYPVDTASLTRETPKWTSASEIVPKNMDYLQKTIQLCKENGIEFTAVVTPIPLETLQDNAQGYQEMWSYLEAFFADQGVPFLNFNDAEHFNLFTHDIMAFTDYDGHMNGDAARAFSKVLSGQLSA